MALNAIRFILILLAIVVSALYVIPITQAQENGTDSHTFVALRN